MNDVFPTFLVFHCLSIKVIPYNYYIMYNFCFLNYLIYGIDSSIILMFLWPKNVYGWFVYLILEYLCRTLILLISFFSISVIEWGSFLLQYGFLITEICYLFLIGRWNFLSLRKWDNTKKEVTTVSLTTNNLSKKHLF